MESNNSSNTLEFIQLVKCIIEYYASTKSLSENKNKNKNESLNELDEASKILDSLNDLNISGMAIEIPKEIDEEVKLTFLSQLNKFKKECDYLNKD